MSTHVCVLHISVMTAPNFDIRDVTETSFNVTWAPPPTWGAYIVHYVEYRKTGMYS